VDPRVNSHAAEVTAAMERCRRETAEIEALILSGHPDLHGLCLALSDWSAELRILQDEKRRQDGTRRRDVKRDQLARFSP
jgi:hypothetical protein